MNREVIPADGLSELDRYRYKSGEYSPLDNFLNPFWEKCTTYVPLVSSWRTLAAVGAAAGSVGLLQRTPIGNMVFVAK